MSFGIEEGALEAYKEAALGLVKRVVGEKSTHFDIQIIDSDAGNDVFELESTDGKIVLRGNTPIAVASSLNWYLKYYCNCQISWNGSNMELPEVLPLVENRLRKPTAFACRAYLNYCTFSYSMPWWDWDRWEQEIDWMAMHGINLPLAITGQEAVWMATLREFKLSDDEIRNFLANPAFMAWQWMGNLEGWGGPLSQHWIDSHLELGKRILKRQRELGMKPILQGFSGHVPVKLLEKFPQAHIEERLWLFNFKTALLDPLDPLFERFAKVFYEKQWALFGTDHLYATDPFHESSPTGKGAEYLEQAGEAIYQAMQKVDPKAVMAIQTWTLREGLLRRIPKDRTLMLSITGTNWKKHQSYWERPWVVGALHNFGGRTYMGGDLEHFAQHALTLLNREDTGNIQGIGVFPEGIAHNPIVYELLTEVCWHQQPIALTTWIPQYVRARYGRLTDHVAHAWEILAHTVYHQKKVKIISMESPICARPALDIVRVSLNGDMIRDYDIPALWDAWHFLLLDAPELGVRDGYQYDVVDLARQCLADLSLFLHKELSEAYKQQNKHQLMILCDLFLDLMNDVDELLATREEFLLGKWLADARKCAASETEGDQYEEAARRLITVWGTTAPNALLFDYAHKQWSGLLKGFYKKRWQQFFDYLQQQPTEENKRYREKRLNKSYDRPSNSANDFFAQLAAWEESWVYEKNSYPDEPTGDPLLIAQRLYTKWLPVKKSKMSIPLDNQSSDKVLITVNREETVFKLLEELPEKVAETKANE
ncbi:alpha-N-acetylglucosaminidase [Olivibacter sp. SDN3]|uniref:alpha-N-acetylglucosaminidase n=1 Tax=Olivibacter sp. SDN3 TaxID=2764720 RepID=UPI001650F76F|nr:alpha-N-acetylglucosaminidase [Olivibacter sp. SDN3]QNL49556.1 alpha-N-acetylglucosaminidase [Olivibacter sp. SDN3]